ncbi:ABC transporter permease [Dactylosporangium darangshiense]|uniref:ABC transporter permease n=1 Tax=Dactylosporangium darangshiense TaxID=579108 RepID=A0ABP8DT49_9ACTN
MSAVALAGVELRKATDTRAARWLLAAVVALTAAAPGLQAAFGGPGGRTLSALAATGHIPVSVLLPVLAVLSVTSEWSQRTALTTFALVPGRWRVVAAKLLAVVALGLGAAVVALGAGAAAFAAASAAGRADGVWDLPAGLAARLTLVDVATMLCGFGFGLLMGGSAAAVAAYYAVPVGWAAAGRLVPALEPAARWLDMSRTRVPLAGAGVTPQDWAHFGASALLWAALPVLLGAIRTARREVA